MTSGLGNFSRRHFLRGSLAAVGMLLVGFDKVAWPNPSKGPANDPCAAGKKIGAIDFSGEAPVPMETAFGVGLDGRMYADLSKLSAQILITPTGSFYIRTRASELLEGQEPWVVRVGGQVARPFNLGINDLKELTKPMGTHLMECSGNARSAHFGMMSVADWAG